MTSGKKTKVKPWVLAVIMARAGSKGLPGKSLRPLLGKPVIAYSFEQARQARKVTRTVVSSDDAAVLRLAKRAGFEMIARPAILASDTARTDDVLRHAVATLQKKAGASWVAPTAVVMLYGNVPVRKDRMIDRCIDMLGRENCDSVQTIAPVGKYHPYWMFDCDNQSRIKKFIPNNAYRRQDLPALFSPTGAVYVMKTQVLMGSDGSSDPHAFLGKDRRGLIVDPGASVDIDTLQDFYVAQAVLSADQATPRKRKKP